MLSVFIKYHYYYLLPALVFSLLACSHTPAIDEHPEFVAALNKKFTTQAKISQEEALSYIDSAFGAIAKPGMGDVLLKDSTKQFIYSITKPNLLKSIAYADSIINLIKNRTTEEKYAERYASAFYEKGQYLLEMKKYSESFYYITLAENEVLTHVKNKLNLAHYSSKVAYLMFAQEKYLESAAYFLKYYKILANSQTALDYPFFANLQRTLNNVALSYLRAGVLDSAAWYQAAALRIIHENEAKFPDYVFRITCAKAVIYADQAELLSLRGDYPSAESLYKKSIVGTGQADASYTQMTMARLAGLYLAEAKTELARETLQQLKSSLDTLPNEKPMLGLQKLSAQLYTLTHQIDSAFLWQQQYITHKETIETRDKKFESIDVGKEFENMELKFNNEMLQKESKLKTLYLIIAVIVFASIAAIAAFVWYNLTRTRKLHLQLQQKNADMQQTLTALEQSHEENNRIIRIVAHDLKSPISAINNLIFSLLRKNYPEDLKEVFRLIKNACSNSMVLINDVLYQKKESTSIRKELVDMKMLLEYCVELLQVKADEKKQNLILDAEDALLMLNRQKMWRVISNIVNNAIKFSPEHAVIDIKLQRKENIVLLSVRDNGIGIPGELKDKIFSMSPEANRMGTFGEESFGLGLSISRKIVEEHEGKIWFDSSESHGSVFYVELPCKN